MARIFDNIKLDLGSHLTKTLQVSDRVDAAVGYFNLRGWSMFEGVVRTKAVADPALPIMRILIGMVMTGPQQETIGELQAVLGGEVAQDADASTARARKAELLDPPVAARHAGCRRRRDEGVYAAAAARQGLHLPP